MKAGLNIKDLHYFNVKDLLDYAQYFMENEKEIYKSKGKTKQGKTYEGSQGALDFLRCQR